MAFYSELNVIMNKIIQNYILENQNICKMLYYYPEENVFDFNPLEKKDLTINERRGLLLKHVFPMPKNNEANAVTEQKGFMTVVLTGGDFIGENKGFRRVTLVIDIIFHLDNWIVRNGYRPYYIAEEIDAMLNNQNTNLPIEGRPIPLPFSVKSYSSAYYGIQMRYELTVNSNIICSPIPKNININNKVSNRKKFLPKNIGDINNGI